MSQSQFLNFVDQENLPVRRGKTIEPNMGLQARSIRPILGEISQNITRRQPVRAAKQAEKSSFPIFCDEENAEVSTKSFASSLPTSRNPLANIPAPLEDKENADLPATKNFRIHSDSERGQLENLRLQQIKPALLQHVDSFSSSSSSLDCSSMDTESPMVLDTSVQDTSIQQWRVPPLSQEGETVDIFSVPEYAQDIYCYLREAETKHLPKWNYMSKQPDITHSMRAILVDWLVEVAEEYKLQTETLYLAVSYIDRFLSYMSVQRAKLQLVGTACMFIASKYEEIYPPDVGEFVYITDDTYNKRQVLRMEHLVLKVLGFDLSAPSSHLFVSQLGEMSHSDEKTQHLAMYLNELSLMSGENFLRYTPSLVAAASLALARHTLGSEAWPASVAESSGIAMAELQECLMALHAVYEQAEDCPQQAVREKYRSTKYHSVSEISPPSISRH
eukprot:GFUD01018409.1.p1 GENE.GFUD01018409.1~~GFUD01018409.1.p1  ORF type:complete len:446 (-),score=114.89 GFUD01018409.1:625-1962(-)